MSVRIRVAAKAARTDADGTVFASASELRRWRELQFLERAGAITMLERQGAFPLCVEGRPVLMRSPRYPNGRQVVYVADFTYFDKEKNEHVVEEHKGFWTEAARLKVAIFEAIYGIRVIVTGDAKRAPRKGWEDIAKDAMTIDEKVGIPWKRNTTPKKTATKAGL